MERGVSSAVVITCSTRAASGVYPDRSGPVIVEALRSWGFETGEPIVVPDGPEVEEALTAAVAAGPDLVLTTGGTGLTPTDGTPEATMRVIDRPVPGIAEAIRAAGVAAGVPAAMLSRGVAGMAGATLVVNLPGSTGGVRDGLTVLEPVVAHAVSQMRGGDH
nr:molybdenum cofactor synthesis domain-containing protein [Oryzihumus leptocrescens]